MLSSVTDSPQRHQSNWRHPPPCRASRSLPCHWLATPTSRASVIGCRPCAADNRISHLVIRRFPLWGGTDPAVVGVWVDVAAAHDGDYVPAGEAVTVFEDRRDAERGRRFDDEASVVEEHPHAGDDRRLLDQNGVVSDQKEVVQDGQDGTPAGDAVSDGAGRVGADDAPLAPRV